VKLLSLRVTALSVIAAVLAAGCGHTGGAAGKASTAGDGVLRIGYTSPQGGPPSGPEGWANQRGLLLPLLKSQGITSIKFTPLPSGPNVNEALAANAIDIAMCGDAPSITGRAAGIPARLITIGTVGTNAYLYTAKNGPKSVDEIRGKIVGTRKGSIVGRYLLGLLAEKGLTDSVKVVQLQDSDAEAALQRGDIAAYAGSNGPLEELRGFRILDQASDHPHLAGAGCTVISQKFLDTHPDFPAAWNSARVVGIKDLQSHLDEYYQGLADRAKVPTTVYRKLYPARQFVAEPFSAQGLDTLGRTKTFLLGQHLLKRDFDIKEWIYTGNKSVAQVNNVASTDVK